MSDPGEIVARYIHGIFCEDIRDEVGGGASYIGVLPPVAAAPGPYPIIFPKFAAVIWIVCPINETLPTLEAYFEMPDGTQIAVPMPTPAPPTEKTSGATRTLGTGIIRAVNFLVSEPGRIRLRVKAWGQLWTPASILLGHLAVENLNTPDKPDK